MRWFRRNRYRPVPMPDKFDVLARYNTERSRGVAHDPGWHARMAQLQAEFNEWSLRETTRRQQ